MDLVTLPLWVSSRFPHEGLSPYMLIPSLVLAIGETGILLDLCGEAFRLKGRVGDAVVVMSHAFIKAIGRTCLIVTSSLLLSLSDFYLLPGVRPDRTRPQYGGWLGTSGRLTALSEP